MLITFGTSSCVYINRNIIMNNKTKKQIVSLLESGKSVEDCVSLLIITDPSTYPTKVSARNDIQELMETESLVVKKANKSGALKEWFMGQEDPLSVTSDQIKEKCQELDMKGGSVQYYINSYKLAIELMTKIAEK